ncbi:hypothetical protein [Streptomyces huasconensis]|uniref:hypothetical protein n=1 Tax=Streptomyces huasconensis TaxID=1854574 RepID=UPI0033C7CB25
MTVTINCGTAAESSRLSFNGAVAEVRDDIATSFGFDSNSVTALNLHELVAEAAQLAQGTTTVMEGLGEAHVVPHDEDRGVPAQSPANPVLDQIAACATVDDLRRLWATNQDAFSDPAVMDAWKARGRALAGS